MKKVAAIALVLVFTSSAAFGGVIGFSPASVDVDINGDTSWSLDIIADSEAGSFDSVDILVGSQDLTLVDFTWNPDPTFVRFFSGNGPDVSGTYASGILFGFFGTAQQDGFTLGTLRGDASGLALGSYTVQVDSDFDGGATVVGPGPVHGSATINVTPEPATLTLLGLAGLALIRRRKTA